MTIEVITVITLLLFIIIAMGVYFIDKEVEKMRRDLEWYKRKLLNLESEVHKMKIDNLFNR